MCTVTMRPAFRATGLRISMAGALLLWLFLLYGRSLYQITPVELRSLWWLLGPLALTVDFLNPLFHSPAVFVGSYLLGVASIVWLATGQVRQSVWRLSFVACGVLALLFPLTLPMTYGEYHLPVGSAPGHPWWWITQPSNLYSSAFKQAQLMHEAGCDYHVLGWSPKNVLHYTSACAPGQWRYDVNTEQSRWSLFGDSNANLDEAPVLRWNGHLYLSQPASLVEAQGYAFLTLERAFSPDGQWEAVVVRWFYGPSDIVVVGREK